jgi:hypothetical protein
MGERLPGFSHCGVKKHGATGDRSLRTKFHPQADCFYINGDSNGGKPIAKKDPFIHWQDMPAHKHNLFKNGLCTMAKWTAAFDHLLTELELEDSTLQDEEDNGGDLGQEDDMTMEEVSALGSIGRGQMQFSWDLEEDQPPRGSPSPAHWGAIKML